MEPLQLLHGGRDRPPCLWVWAHLDLPMAYDKTQKLDEGDMELIFLCLYIQTILQESLHNLVDMGNGFIHRSGEDEDVV